MEQRIVILGATSGIGLASAETFVAMGWRVGVAGRNEAVLRSLKERFPANIEYERIDVTHADAPRRLLELIRRLGGMDVYFHVAGIYAENPDLDVDSDTAILQTNTVGFARMVDTAYAFFRARGRKAQIAAVTSVAGTKGIGRLAAYSASKKFQQTYLQAVEQLARRQGVRVRITDIRPGWVETPLLDPDRTYRMAMPLDKVVPQVVRAIVKKARIAVVDSRWRAVVMLWRLIPGRLWVRMPVEVSSPRQAPLITAADGNMPS